MNRRDSPGLEWWGSREEDADVGPHARRRPVGLPTPHDLLRGTAALDAADRHSEDGQAALKAREDGVDLLRVAVVVDGRDGTGFVLECINEAWNLVPVDLKAGGDDERLVAHLPTAFESH